jgi:tetratricopeptide (TPR) repeat protein
MSQRKRSLLGSGEAVPSAVARAKGKRTTDHRLLLRMLLVIAVNAMAWLSLPPAHAHGDLQPRIEALTSQIESHPRNARLYLQRGELHRLDADPAAALADYDRAERLDPCLAAVYFCRGVALRQFAWPEHARDSLDRYLALQPDDAQALLERGHVRLELREYVGAARDFTRAIQRPDPPRPEVFLDRAQAQAAAGDTHLDEALRGLDEGIRKLGPLVTLQLAAIDLELRLRRWDAALARLETIAAQSGRKETWLARRAEILEQAGRAAEAHAAFEAAQQAITALPERLRGQQATMELEARVRTGVARVETRSK